MIYPKSLILTIITNFKIFKIGNFEYYLKGVYSNRKKYWITSNIEDFRDSEQMFLKAIDLDPAFAPAYAELADLYNTYWDRLTVESEEKQKYLDLQEKYIKTAFELDSMSAIVNRVMGWVYMVKQEEIGEVIALMKKAAKLDANDPENIRSLGTIYDLIGLKNLASMSYDRCIDLDPLDVKNYYYQAGVHLNMGRFQKAKSDLQKALQLEQNDPRFLFYYTWLLFLMEEYDEAENLCSKYNQLYPNTSENRFLRAVLYAKSGEKEKALALDLPPNKKDMIFLYLKMDEEAIRYLKNSSKQIKKSKRSNYLFLNNHPIYDFLRPDPRFQEILIKHKEVYDENLRICEAIDG
jgi:tetratricopeptide (TPR) repeat protein